MSQINREQFLKRLGVASTGAVAAGMGLFNRSFARNVKTIDNIGLQLYSIIPLLSEDFEGTLQMLAEVGYSELEFAGPYYFTPNSDDTKSGFYGNNAREMRSILKKYGLFAPAAHVNIGTLQNNLPEVVEAANIVGIEYVICPFLMADQRQALDDYKKLADQFNAIGEKCNEAGLQFAYHNHSYEFGELEGEIPYNVLLDSTDPSLVAMELDLFWITMAGYDPVDYFDEYPGRFHSVHVKDMKRKMVLENPLTTFENRETAKKAFGNLEDVGRGVMDFKRILSAHAKAGIKHYFIERDRAPNPMQTVKNGYAHLSKLDIG